MNLTCPSCGFSNFTSKDFFGRFVKCPRCPNQYIVQGDAISEITECYAYSTLTVEEAVELCFRPLIDTADVDTAKKIMIIGSGQEYLPFIENVYKKKSILTCLADDNPIGLVEIEDTDDVKRQKLFHNPQTGIKKIRKYDISKIESLSSERSFVGSTIKYLPVRFISFMVGDRKVRYAVYGHTAVIIEGDPTILDVPKKDTKRRFLFFAKIAIWLLTIAVVVSAWYKYCYAFYHFHGILKMVFLSVGYKNLLPFIGTCFFALIGSVVLSQAAEDINVYAEDLHLRKRKKSIRQILLQKLGK